MLIYQEYEHCPGLYNLIPLVSLSTWNKVNLQKDIYFDELSDYESESNWLSLEF